MATLSVQAITRAGLTPALAAAAGGGDRFLPSKDTFIRVTNGGGAPITVTVTTTKTDGIGNPVADNVVSVTNGQTRDIGPFPAEHYASAADGLADIAYSGVTTVTVGAFQLVQP